MRLLRAVCCCMGQLKDAIEWVQASAAAPTAASAAAPTACSAARWPCPLLAAKHRTGGIRCALLPISSILAAAGATAPNFIHPCSSRGHCSMCSTLRQGRPRQPQGPVVGHQLAAPYGIIWRRMPQGLLQRMQVELAAQGTWPRACGSGHGMPLADGGQYSTLQIMCARGVRQQDARFGAC